MHGDEAPHSKETRSLTREIKEKALSSGADLVGILKGSSIDSVPRHWVGWQVQKYTKRTTDYMGDSRSVVVLGYHAWDDVHEIVIPKGDRLEYPVYDRMRLFARRVLRFMEGEGHKAIMDPYLLSKKRMAQLAGLGCFGKNSLIINPKYGPWMRLQCILTDAELVPDEPFEGDLCGDCEECIEACPVGALTPYRIDPDRCLIGLTEAEWVGVATGKVDYGSIRDTPNIQAILDEYVPRLTGNSRLMCTTCQKACPYGREERGLI